MTKQVLMAVMISGLFLGCTKSALPSVQALSSTLVEMKATGVSPFDQNFNANKYAIFSGSCLTIITNLQISFNGGPWVDIPASAPIPLNGNDTINGITYPYTETLTPGGTYDVNCSDGNFNFWLYGHQVDEMIFQSQGIAPNIVDISQISLRGISGAYATSPTLYISPYKSTPSKITLIKSAPIDAMAGTCAELIVGLKSADNKSANSSAAIPFSLSHTINGASDSSLMVYLNPSDCSTANTPAQVSASALSIPSNKNELRVYYAIPAGGSSGGNLGDNHIFNVNYSNNPITLDLAFASKSFLIKPSTTKYLDIQNPYKILINTCYPITINSKDYSGAAYNSTSDVFTVNVSADLEIFPTSSCSAPITSFTIGGTSKTLYVKLKSTAADGSGLIGFSTVAFDASASPVEYDISADVAVNSVRVNGPQNIPFGANYFFSISQYNKYGTPLLVASAQNIPINLDYISKGYFCISGSCNSGVTSVTIPAGSYSGVVEYKPLLGGPVTLIPNMSGVSNYGNSINVSGGIVGLAFSSPPSTITSGACTTIVLKTKDIMGLDFMTSTPLAVTVSGFGPGELFSSASCVSGNSGTVIVPGASSSVTFYWRPVNTNGTSRVFTATVPNAPGFTSTSFNVTVP